MVVWIVVESEREAVFARGVVRGREWFELVMSNVAKAVVCVVRVEAEVLEMLDGLDAII